LACGSKEKVFLTWSDNSRKEKAADIWCAVTHSGTHFLNSRPINVSSTPGVSSQPAIAAGEMGRLAITWADTSGGGKNSRIFARVSLDGGSDFTTVMDLSNAPGESKHSDVTIAGSKMFIVWEDVKAEGTESKIKVTSVDIRVIPTGPAQDVDPTLHIHH
jgi:hypothetical protein